MFAVLRQHCRRRLGRRPDVIAHTMSPGQLVQFIFYAVLVAGGVGALSETWGDVQRAAGASERLDGIAARAAGNRRAGQPQDPAEAGPRRGDVSRCRISAIPRGPTLPRSTISRWPSSRAKRWRWSARPAPANRRCSSLLLRFYRGAGRHRSLFDGVDIADLDPPNCAAHIALVAQDPVIFSGTHRRQHPLRPPRSERRRRARGGGCRRGREFIDAVAARLWAPRRRTRHDAVRRPAPAHRHRARHAARRAAASARRGHQRARCRERTAGADRPCQSDGRAHDASSSPTVSPRSRS